MYLFSFTLVNHNTGLTQFQVILKMALKVLVNHFTWTRKETEAKLKVGSVFNILSISLIENLMHKLESNK